MVDSQLMEEEVRGTEVRDAGTKTQKGPTEPISQAQTTPSPSLAFVKENIDVLRTMIKVLHHQAKAKATPRKLVYIDSEKEALDRSMTKSFSDRLSLESTGTSDTRGKTHSAGKGQKGISKDKEPSCLRRSKLSFEEKWLHVRQRLSVPFREIKETLVRSGLEDKKRPKIGMDKGRHEEIWECIHPTLEGILLLRLQKLKRKSWPQKE
ncbi:hypothetical protein Tco_0312203 [Tanacetum coccineum]